jgi:hypothetical protein
MKTIVNAFFILIAFLLGIVDAVAKNNPPLPNPNGKTNGPELPGLPIDEHLFYLLIIAVFFGIYIIYTCKLNTKSPV